MNEAKIKKITGLWIGKTGQGNAWYHIYPFVKSKYNNELNIVRYQYPQRNINDQRAIFYTFSSKGYFSQVINFLKTGYKVLKIKHIDYIVSFNLVPWATLSWILAKLFRKPIIIGLIGSDFHKYLFQNKSKFFFSFILKHTDIITTTGNQMLEHFKTTTYYKNVFIYPHCLPDEWFEEKNNKIDREWSLISISELKPNKRIIDIINAVNILKQRGIFVNYKIIGEGPVRQNLIDEVKKLRLDNRIKFLGYQKNILSHLKNSKIFVQASIKEGLSLSLIEALGAGVVPIITEAGSEKDIVSHDFDCLFFKTSDVEDLAKKIEYALINENFNRLLNNVLITRENFKINNAIHKVEEIQRYLIEKLTI